MTNPLRLLREYRAASALNNALEDGAQHPGLYRTEPLWTRVVLAAIALVGSLPLPKGLNMSQFWHKLAIASGLILTVGSQVQGMQLPLPSNVQGILGVVLAVAAALYHNVPGSPAGPQAIGAK